MPDPILGAGDTSGNKAIKEPHLSRIYSPQTRNTINKDIGSYVGRKLALRRKRRAKRDWECWRWGVEEYKLQY